MNMTWISNTLEKGKDMSAGLWQKIKNFGVGKAIDALDNLETPLAQRIDEQKAKIQSLNSQQLSKWIVDEVQFWLKSYFKVPTDK